MNTVSATTGPDYLTSLPRELRYRIYDFAFNDAVFILATEEVDQQKLYTLTPNFPIALTATCQLLHTEVKKYLTTLWGVPLVLNIKETEFELPNSIPERYLERVRTLGASYEVVLRNKLDLILLSDLSYVVLLLPNLILPCAKDDTDALFTTKKTTGEMNEIVRGSLDTAFNLWEEFDDLKAAIKKYLEEKIEVRLQVRLCFGEEEVVNVVFDIEIDYVPGEGVWTTARYKVLDEPTPFFGTPGYLPSS